MRECSSIADSRSARNCPYAISQVSDEIRFFGFPDVTSIAADWQADPERFPVSLVKNRDLLRD